MTDDLSAADNDRKSEPLRSQTALEALKQQTEALGRALAGFRAPLIPDWIFTPLPRFPALALSQDLIRQVQAANAIAAQLVPPPAFTSQLAGLARVLTEGLRRFWPAFEKWRRDQQEAIEALASQGWWPHPEWPASIMYEVLRLKRERKLRSLDRVICDSYEVSRFRPMRRAMESWWVLPEYKARRAILRAGFTAYKNCDYISAVSVWLPQIEGVMRARAERGGLSASGWKRALEKENTGGQEEVEARLEDIVTNSFWAFFRSLYETKTLNITKIMARRDFPLRRDLVLHGLDLRYGRRANAMRIFLMLDTLHHFVIQYDKAAAKAA